MDVLLAVLGGGSVLLIILPFCLPIPEFTFRDIREKVQFKIPFSDELESMLQSIESKLTPRTIALQMLLSLTVFPLAGGLILHKLSIAALLGLVMAGATIFVPVSKYKKHQKALDEETYKMVAVMSMYLGQNGRPIDGLRQVERTVKDPLKKYVTQMLKRMETIDALGEGLMWLADKTKVELISKMANQVIQSERYRTPAGPRLLKLMQQEHDKRKALRDKKADTYRTKAVTTVSLFIAMPLVLLFVMYQFVHANMQLNSPFH